ncbi:gfo/Idh/MocA family oxidoreductase [Candidatus Poribacteria bacterium]|nr:gfo/Idh/MocA family oxidoreductase [Candidatus Poribacteria bacterium]
MSPKDKKEKSDKKVRAAIVGMGIGRPNGQAIQKNPRGEIVALCDLKEDRMMDFAKSLPNEVKFYTDYKKMCKDKEIDAVFVGTPNQWHVPIALEAVKRDKHVMVTKPLADSEKAAEKLVEAAESAGVVNMMSLSTRFADNCKYMGSLEREGFFGEIYYARARSVRRSGIPAWNLGFIQKGGGAFRDMGVHVLDAVWWIMGMPKPVSVKGVAGAKFGPRGLGYWNYNKPEKEVYEQYKSDDYAGGLITFEGGIGLQVESFWASHQPEELQIELFGTEAGGKLNPVTLYITEHGTAQNTMVNIPKGPSSWDNIAGHFIDCILNGVECQAPLRHGLIVQQMMEAVLKSAEKGKEIRLDKGDKKKK